MTSIVAVYYYLRLVVAMYMQPASGLLAAPAAILVAAAGVLLIGLFPESLLRQSSLSIESLLGK